eukprot:TRINITY_DN95837_c0_g1_i1.p1 TRINITY_DN95837_c0_g1~~TRINITY_DN95837_c0_g1_i1.p1  ORF type:complete len:488 (-),score=27.75 TRINITY_DN95837_c0_g1_i1:18-1448(-)
MVRRKGGLWWALLVCSFLRAGGQLCRDVRQWRDGAKKNCRWYERSQICKGGKVLVNVDSSIGHYPELNCCACGRAVNLAQGKCWSPGYTPETCCPAGKNTTGCFGYGFTSRACCDDIATEEAKVFMRRIKALSTNPVPAACGRLTKENRDAMMLAPLFGNGLWQVNLPDQWRRQYRMGRRKPPPGCFSTEIRDDTDVAKFFLRLRRKKIPLAGWVVNLGAGPPFSDYTYSMRNFTNMVALEPQGPPNGPSKEMIAKLRPNIRYVTRSATLSNLGDLLEEGGLRCKGKDAPVPIDVLKIDIDSCDCQLLQGMLRLVRPKFITLEINWGFPPPFKFQRMCHSDLWKQTERAVRFGRGLSGIPFGCSLAAAVSSLRAHRYVFLGLLYHEEGGVGGQADFDAAFLDEGIAAQMGIQGSVDEVECYRLRAKMGTFAFMPREWLNVWAQSDVDETLLAHAWCAMHQYSYTLRTDHLPFSLSL